MRFRVRRRAALRALCEQFLQACFQAPAARLAGVDLADRTRPDPPAAVHQVKGRPVLVVERSPIRVVVVEQLREVEVVFANLGGHRCADPLGLELRGVDADDRQAAGGMASEGVPDPGNRADTVDSAKGPDIEQDDLSAQVRQPDGGPYPTRGILRRELGCFGGG